MPKTKTPSDQRLLHRYNVVALSRIVSHPDAVRKAIGSTLEGDLRAEELLLFLRKMDRKKIAAAKKDGFPSSGKMPAAGKGKGKGGKDKDDAKGKTPGKGKGKGRPGVKTRAIPPVEDARAVLERLASRVPNTSPEAPAEDVAETTH